MFCFLMAETPNKKETKSTTSVSFGFYGASMHLVIFATELCIQQAFTKSSTSKREIYVIMWPAMRYKISLLKLFNAKITSLFIWSSASVLTKCGLDVGTKFLHLLTIFYSFNHFHYIYSLYIFKKTEHWI